MNRKAIVIGAGFGGLALAIRLQSAGIDTTLVEARDRPGGRAYMWEKDGFVFDAGPTVITDPDCLGEFWRLSGPDMAEGSEERRVGKEGVSTLTTLWSPLLQIKKTTKKKNS